VTRLDYGQYLLASQINYPLTNFADHCERFSHDAINRYLRGAQITPRRVWDNVREQLVLTPRGYVVFDDTVLDKDGSFAIELVRHQYSGNAQAVIKGIGGGPVSRSIPRPTSSGGLTTGFMIRTAMATANSITCVQC
jgi:hypothetical protein